MKTFMPMFIAVLMLLLVVSPIISEQEIVEEVSVDWWQVPVFAVDKDGNPVMDLEPEDIEVTMNDRIIPTFTLEKRTFAVSERSRGVESAPAAAEEKPALMKKKVIFLLFDRATSTPSTIRKGNTIYEAKTYAQLFKNADAVINKLKTNAIKQ